MNNPSVWIIMWSISDAPVMEAATEILEQFNIPYEKKVVSAHRTPEAMVEYATTAAQRWLKVIIAWAWWAAHLPWMTASLTTLPVIGVPVKTSTLSGLDSLYSIVQMPAGVPVATMAINGAKNAWLFAAQVLAITNPDIQQLLEDYMEDMKWLVDDMNEEL